MIALGKVLVTIPNMILLAAYSRKFFSQCKFCLSDGMMKQTVAIVLNKLLISKLLSQNTTSARVGLHDLGKM
jgi:hypothetical protein